VPSPAPSTAPPAAPSLDLHLPPASPVSPTGRLALGGQADPRGLATDADGNIYVVTGTEAKVHKFSPAGTELTSWPLTGKDGRPAGEPFSVAVVGDRVLVLDAATSDLLRYDRNGTPQGPIHACECFFPRGLLADRDGTIWVADTGGGRLVHLTTDAQPLGTLLTRGTGPGQAVEPTALWRAADGSLYVADVGNNRVQRLGPDGTFQAQWPIGHSIARDGARLTGDAAGHLYVSLPESGAVAVYDADGKPLATWQPTNPPLRSSAVAVSGATLLVAYPFDAQVVGVPVLP
jgi:sugar lactone lactonase YvrE